MSKLRFVAAPSSADENAALRYFAMRGWMGRIRRHRLGASLGLLTIAAAAIAQQAYEGHTEWFDSAEQAIVEAFASMMTAKMTGVADQTPVDLMVGMSAHDATVGNVDGQAGVSGGGASYSIPILVPPGRRGMQPELSLSYSSRAGNGIAGMGWSLSATSSVHRCPSTLEQDGVIRPVDLSANDKLCLDGQRLVAVSGSYGSSGAKYATEIDSFARVTQLGGGLTSTATYFKVESKSGDIQYYGGNGSIAVAYAQVVPGGVSSPMSWLLERKQDRVGNLVRYVYANYGNGEALLSSILYTGFNTSDGDRKVEFAYETRPAGGGANDQSSSYLAGGLTRQTQRLATITTRVGTQAVRQYRLGYQISSTSSRSLLSSVTECGYAGALATCRPSTQFTWQQQAPSYQFHPLDLQQTAGSPLAPDRITSMKPGGDFNGDGVAEYVIVQHTADFNAYETYLASLSSDRQVRMTMTMGAESVADYYQNVDFDLDGKSDYLIYDGGNNLLVRFWHGPADATTFASAFNDSWTTGINLPVIGANSARIRHTGDMDGDGRADILVQRNTPAGAASCKIALEFYKNTPAAGGGTAASTFPLTSTYCLAFVGTVPTSSPPFPTYESLREVRDFNGDGLMDLLIYSMPATARLTAQPNRVAYGQRTTPHSFVNKPYAQLFPGADPLQTSEGDGRGYSLWADLNGDGLDDLVFGRGGAGGTWTFRMNTGVGFGVRQNLQTNVGIEHCDGENDNTPNQFGETYCQKTAYSPWHARDITVADIDSDGRAEILIPRRFAEQSCNPIYPDPNQCGNPHAQSPGFLTAADADSDWKGEAAAGGPLECHEIRYMCSEHPLTGQTGLGAGLIQFNNAEEAPAYGLHKNGYALFDQSRYLMDALRVVENAAGGYSLVQVPTSIIGGAGAEDVYGDGMQDILVSAGCTATNFYRCADPVADGAGNPYPESQVPRTYPGGYPFHAQALYINENQGASSARNPDGLTPQATDILSMVTDGMGVQTTWTYYPLNSKAGRGPTETPLYSVPTQTAQRYVDDRHFYFTSSMPVVSEMIQSDGRGDYRSWRYGYSEAMYHVRGRGFQGFRTIIEEDEAAGRRTTTTFHQKFPLTSQPEQIVVNSLKRSGVDGPISKQTFAWRCNRLSRLDANACTPPSGTIAIKFPFLDTQETWTYDAATADNPTGGTPALVGYRKQVAADDGMCTGAFTTASGYDAYGNLTASTVLSSDGTGSLGYRSFVASHCVRTLATYAAADTTNWWVDKLDSRSVSTAIAYNASQHALPGGVSNPTQTVTSSNTWNSDRTPATETTQSGIANQQRVTTYGYPASGNYGLPDSVSVAASGDPNGTRAVTTTYSSDGYFPLTVKNPLLHDTTTLTRKEDGQPSQVTDANGLRTQFDYDAFGQRITTRFRGASDGEMRAPDKRVLLSWCAVGGCVANGVYFARTVQDGTPITTVIYDRLGRPLRTRTRLLDETDSVSDTQYDSAGRVAQQSQPYRSGETIYWTQFVSYDVLGRVTQKIVPQANHDLRGNLKTTYTYSGRSTGIQVCGSADPNTSNCLNLSRTTDSLGRYVETVDAKNGTTRFWYDGAGNALAIQDANGYAIKATYNAIGQRTSVNDPNQGNWNFGYNALGEVLSQTDARRIVTSSLYDKLGRPTQSAATYDYDGVAPLDLVQDNFVYDPAYAKGQEASQTRKINTSVQRTITTTYDALSRPIIKKYDNATGTAGVFLSLTQETSYDTYYGRPKAQGYGNAETLWLRYSKYGDLIRESDANTGADYRVVNSVDSRGNPIQEILAGGNLTAARSYLPQTGQLASVQYGNLSNPSLRKLDYRYDVFGNLGQQSLNTSVTTETYQYDALHRLTRATRIGQATGTGTFDYDATGNFKSKSDFSKAIASAYTYTGGACGGGPNAVKSVQLRTAGTRTYCYDDAGNMTSDNAGLAVEYDHTQRPIVITRNGVTRNFRYDAEGTRFWQFGGGDATQYYPGVEKRFGSINDEKTYLGSSTIATQVGSTRTLQYLLTDRLGSVDAVSDANGNLIESRGYDAFGKPRTGTWADATPPRLGTIANTPHGYTGHEHLNAVELIHMNGRVYDYSLGRFMGVDPVIQFPLNSQSLNPYSYILNNPLSSTDPSGYAAKCGKTIADGEVCEVEVKERVKTEGSNIRKTVTTTYTIANNGGAVYAAQGTGAGAYRAIEKAMIGAPSTRSNGPNVGPTPMSVVERATMACAKAGSCDDNPAYLVNPNEPSGLAKAWGEIKGAFSAPDQNGLRYNTATNSPVANPTETKQNVMIGLLTFFMPAPKGIGLVPTEAAASRGGIGPVVKGMLGVERTIAAAEARGEVVLGKEISIRVASGGGVRPDVLVRMPNGGLKFIESKCGPSACLNSNQRGGYPQIREQGGIPRGANAARAGLQPGEPLGPTPVQVDWWK